MKLLFLILFVSLASSAPRKAQPQQPRPPAFPAPPFNCNAAAITAAEGKREPVFFVVPDKESSRCLDVVKAHAGKPSELWTNAVPTDKVLCRGHPRADIRICTLTEAIVDQLAKDQRVGELKLNLDKIPNPTKESDFLKFCFACD